MSLLRLRQCVDFILTVEANNDVHVAYAKERMFDKQEEHELIGQEFYLTVDGAKELGITKSNCRQKTMV